MVIGRVIVIRIVGVHSSCGWGTQTDRSPNRSTVRLACGAGGLGYSARMTSRADGLSITPTDDGYAIVGEIDAHTAPSLASALADSSQDRCSLDLSGVVFIDSSGLRVLIEAHQQASAAGGSLQISRPSPVVQRLFEISGVGEYLDVS